MVRLPKGTAHALDGLDFRIQVMGKTGTTSDLRDALFVESTCGPQGITVAVRIGFDGNRTLGERETGSRAALPILRETMLRLYRDGLVTPLPQLPCDIEARIDAYLAVQAVTEAKLDGPLPGHEDRLAAPPGKIPASRLLPRRAPVGTVPTTESENTRLAGPSGLRAGSTRWPNGYACESGFGRRDPAWKVELKSTDTACRGHRSTVRARSARTFERYSQEVIPMRKTLWLKCALLGAPAPSWSIAAYAHARSDAWITMKAKHALYLAGDVKGTAINVDTINGRVTRHGTVYDQKEKSRAAEEVRKIEGVTDVRNLLQVVSRTNAEMVKHSDDHIRMDVEKHLKADRSLDDSSIAVRSVDNGVVHLTGRAASLDDNQRALCRAASRPGVNRVTSGLDVSDTLSDDDFRTEESTTPETGATAS